MGSYFTPDMKQYKSGAIKWVADEDGECYVGRMVCVPWKCKDGETRTLVEAEDGVWEVNIKSLSDTRPENAKLSKPLSILNEERMMAKKSAKKIVKKTVGKKAEGVVLCRCGCGEALTEGGKKGRMFRQGHDSRFHGRVKKLKDGRLTMSELSKMIQPYALGYYKEAVGTKARKRRIVKKK